MHIQTPLAELGDCWSIVLELVRPFPRRLGSNGLKRGHLARAIVLQGSTKRRPLGSAAGPARAGPLLDGVRGVAADRPLSPPLCARACICRPCSSARRSATGRQPRRRWARGRRLPRQRPCSGPHGFQGAPRAASMGAASGRTLLAAAHRASLAESPAPRHGITAPPCHAAPAPSPHPAAMPPLAAPRGAPRRGACSSRTKSRRCSTRARAAAAAPQTAPAQAATATAKLSRRMPSRRATQRCAPARVLHAPQLHAAAAPPHQGGPPTIPAIQSMPQRGEAFEPAWRAAAPRPRPARRPQARPSC